MEKNEPEPIKTITIKKIIFNSYEGLTVVIPAGSSIVVDIDEGIAKFGFFHFDISKEEYRLN